MNNNEFTSNSFPITLTLQKFIVIYFLLYEFTFCLSKHLCWAEYKTKIRWKLLKC